MKEKLLICLVLVLLVATGCSSSQDPVDLQLDVTYEIIEDDLMKVYISTNLPNTAKGTITLANESLNYTAQDDFTVESEAAVAGPFSYFGDPIPSGDYTITCTFRAYELQPESVQALIGDGFSNYISEYIDASDEEVAITYSFPITIE